MAEAMTAPLGVILAGGRATRMGGGDKGLLTLGRDGVGAGAAGGRTILDEVIARLGPQVSGMALNANGDPARFAGLGLAVLPDSVDGFAGPLAGVLAGMDWAAGRGASHVVTVAADTPFFPCDLVPRLQLAAEAGGRPIALAATPDPQRGLARHPTFGLWPVGLRDDLRAALADGVRKVVAWTDRHGTALAEFPVDRGDPFFNVNTPQDLERARGMPG